MTLLSDQRVSPIAWLMGCFLIGVLTYWYPLVLAHSFERDVDSRIGFGYTLTGPVLLAASVRAVWEYVRLRRLLANTPGEGNRAFHTLGAVLLVASLSPLVVFGALMIWGANR